MPVFSFRRIFAAVKKRVLLGFSGGIDSCLAALSLMRQGYDVSLLTLDMTGDRTLTERAGHSASELGLPQRTVDVRELFRRQVTGPFIDSYRNGKTPSPCVRCNPAVKWRTLYDTAVREGFDHIATGHYFRIARQKDTWLIRRGADPAKDQSYYLWNLPQSVLEIALAPMGETVKSEAARTLPASLRPRESMGVCFMEGQKPADFLKARIPGIRPGEVVDPSGRTIGTHPGYPLCTIGQKRGLSLGALTGRYAVTEIHPESNRVTAGPDSELYRSRLEVGEFRAPDIGRLTGSNRVRVRVRGIGRNPEGFAQVRPEGDRLVVRLDSPAWAPAPGQPVVFYEDDLVLGGGILLSARS